MRSADDGASLVTERIDAQTIGGNNSRSRAERAGRLAMRAGETMDKLKAMSALCRVAEAKSFASAAQALGVVPSALSKTVAALEDGLGFRLLNRTTRGLSLTDEGAAYVAQCRQILQDIEQAEAQGRGGTLQARGTLRIGMHPALRFEMLNRMGRFLESHPQIKVETTITNSPSAVIDEGMDVVLHVGRLLDSSLIAKPLGWTRPIVCASPRYLETWGEPMHPTDLVRHRAVIYARRDEEANTRWSFSRGNTSCDVDVPVHTVSRDGIGLVDAAIGGCGVARPLDIAARYWIATGHLRVLLADWAAERLAVHAVLPPRGPSPSAKVRAFLDHVAQVLRADGEADGALGETAPP